MNDGQRVLLHINSLSEGEEISDACARVIASWWSEGTGPGVRFVSTGTITDPPDDVWRDLTYDAAIYMRANGFERRTLDYLGTYLINKGPRDPQEGWSSLWLRDTNDHLCDVPNCHFEWVLIVNRRKLCATHAEEIG